MLFSKLFLIL